MDKGVKKGVWYEKDEFEEIFRQNYIIYYGRNYGPLIGFLR